MSKYLYGASIQGIQNFIFQTNKLKEIVGGSELVEDICTRFFQVFLKKNGIPYEEEHAILQAAGNIKYEFQNATDCEKVVLKFQKEVMEKAPGITVSQAVVKLDDKNEYKNALQQLEDKLKIQRIKSKYVSSQISHFMLSETARRTGGVGVHYSFQNEVIDASQKAKSVYSDSANARLYQVLTGMESIREEDKVKEMDDLKGSKSNGDNLESLTSKGSWIAVVHADGNNLGRKLIAMYDHLPGELIKKVIKEFSTTLDKATKEAAKEAYNDIVKDNIKKEDKIPIRPIIIGGDDLTVVIRGDLAVPFINKFLKDFERITKSLFGQLESRLNLADHSLNLSEGLTACAGIAFIKPKYPFHYGADLAENLCAKAKKASKEISGDFPPSSLAFHKVQSSYIEEMEEVEKKELTAKNGLRFDFGPYFLATQESYATIDQLLDWCKSINRPTAPKSNIREWLGTLRDDPEQASYLMDNIVNKLGNRSDYFSDLGLKKPKRIRGDKEFTHLFDVVSLSNI